VILSVRLTASTVIVKTLFTQLSNRFGIATVGPDMGHNAKAGAQRHQ
jgi:hypothetical protein